MRLRRRSRLKHQACATDHGITAIAEPGGAGVIGFARNVNPPPTMGPEPIANRHSLTDVDQEAALLDVQLNKGPDASQRLGVGADAVRLPPRPAQYVRHR